MSEWISVDDRLPEAGVKVLVFRPMAGESHEPNITISFRLVDGIETVSPQGIQHPFDCWCHVTHWYPLPASPEYKK